MEGNAQAEPIPVRTGLFTQEGPEGSGPSLLGGYCPVCGSHHFPRPKFCPRCLGALEERPVGGRGRIHSFTVVRAKPPLGLPQPYSVGYVDLDRTGLRVFCLLDPERIEELRVGARVRLEAGVLGHDGRGGPMLRPYFTPEEPTGK